MNSHDDKLHIMFLPFVAPGHMMPLVDIARLLARNNYIRVTIIVTRGNALRFKSAIDRDIQSGRKIALEILQFPYEEAGLPEGCENFVSTPTPQMSMKLIRGIELLQPEIEKIFQTNHPDCIATDYLYPWTVKVARELGIPRLAFNGSGYFNLCVSHSIQEYKPHKDIESESETFFVPDLPDEVKLTRSQLPDIVKTKTDFSALFKELEEAERNSFGVLVNSFDELEPGYADHFRKVKGLRTWSLGPISLFHESTEDKAERGDNTSVTKQDCLSWLDSKSPNSVLYICFGSLTRFSKDQTAEIARAVEESGYSFLWVVGKVIVGNNDIDGDNIGQENETWLPEGFEEKVTKEGKGLIIKGWAPQVLILDHPAIGGFLTHCGWNSVLEGVSAGVPMVTWPVFAEQFYNEKLITQVLKIGVSVGNEIWKIWATENSPLIGGENIKRAVCAVMNENDEAVQEMRRKARSIRDAAKKTVDEGGSSYNNMKTLIEDIRLQKRN